MDFRGQERNRNRRGSFAAKKGHTPPRVNSVLLSSFSGLGIAVKLREYKIRKAWADSVGPAIARNSSPTGLNGTVLYCAVSSSPWIAELSYHKRDLIAKLNKRLDEGAAVTDVVFRLGEVPKTQEKRVMEAEKRRLTPNEEAFIEKTVVDVKDDGLRDLIKRVMEKSLT